ncbi:hypothetical protein KKF84_11820 [Myxococcota bacterium]|nr:hypothetical protein [Myxococcota bacterium]MBU1536001.1 hypothetical protein [Myxococcota bacterium]
MKYTFMALCLAALSMGACSLLTDFSEDSPVEICDNGIDDDNDGFIDCDDSQCRSVEACVGGEICDNGSDDDGDALVDCDDPDCESNQACQVTNETLCADGIDNDDDGHIDCADQDCINAPECMGAEEICDNGIDDNDNALIDCEEPSCANHPFCAGNTCPEEAAYFDSINSAFCSNQGVCTFMTIPGSDGEEIISGCGPVDGKYYDYNKEGLCPKGAPNLNGVCATLCNTQHSPCPPPEDATAGITPLCRMRDLPPILVGKGLCVLEASCDPYLGTGCPLEHFCKLDVQITTDTGTQLLSVDSPYCTQPFESRFQDEDCFANEECEGHLSCVKKQGDSKGTCLSPCDGTSTSCDNFHSCVLPEGGDSIGYCLPVSTN